MRTHAFYLYSPELEKNIVIQYFVKNSCVILKGVSLIDSINLPKFISENDLNVKKLENIENEYVVNMVKILNLYLEGKQVNLYDRFMNLGINIDYKTTFKTDFAQSIINELLKVDYGKTISYSELAFKLNSKASRAVGNIMRKNPFPLIIPCHRVIKKNREIGKFTVSLNDISGTNLKRKLIELEKNE